MQRTLAEVLQIQGGQNESVKMQILRLSKDRWPSMVVLLMMMNFVVTVMPLTVAVTLGRRWWLCSLFMFTLVLT